MPPPKRRANDPTDVSCRLIQRCAAGTAGAVVVAGASYRPQPLNALNGVRGMQSGHYERWLGSEGSFTIDLPNTHGPDGKLHINRFLNRTDPAWMPGDEWIEIRRDKPPTLLYVGAVVNIPNATIGKLPVGGYDAMWMLKKIRETEAGFWNHAPRDVMEHYTRCWTFNTATAFPEAGAVSVTTDGPTTTGSFTYTRARTNTGLPVARLLPQAAGVHSNVVLAATPPTVGFQSVDPYAPWRAEASLYISAAFPSLANVVLGSTGFGMQLVGVTSTTSGLLARMYNGAGGTFDVPVPGAAPLLPGQVDLAIEGRERWVFCYVNGQLIGVYAMPPTHAAVNAVDYDAEGGTANVDVQSFTYERGLPWLMRGTDKGSYVLPGTPTPGGLHGDYFDDGDLVNVTLGGDLILNPTRQPYWSRLDATIQHRVAGSAWQPQGPAQFFSARWTGAVYLDLANFDYRFQMALANFARLWVGKTRFGEQTIDAWPIPGSGTSVTPAGPSIPWTSGYMRALLGSVSGWYPLRLEMTGSPGGAAYVDFERSDTPGTFNPVPATMVSPYGCYNNHLRHDSHYDTLQAVAGAFGYQYTCQPKSLESGLFPGQVIPRVRVGRDTVIKTDENDATDLALNSAGEDMAVRIVADAQGIADTNGGAQLTATAINYANATGHMFAVTESESLSDITDPQLLAQRLNTLLALRSGTWDQVASRPKGHPVLADNWPPPTVPLPSKMAYEPGDGVFRSFPTLGLVDQVPTQLMSLAWDFTPHAIIAPQASFFIYPRGTYWTLRKFRQQDAAHNRNYQGQLAVYPGSLGGLTGTGGPTIAADAYSRLVLPGNAAKTQRVFLQVTTKLDTSKQWTIEINGMATPILVNAAGSYDVTAYAALQAIGTRQQMIARLIPMAANDLAEYVLMAKVIV